MSVHVRVCTCIFHPHSNLQEVMNKLFDQQCFHPAQDNLGNAQEHKNTRIHPDSQKKDRDRYAFRTMYN